jgi:thiamine-phosphate pyrophosphorylase
MPAKGRTEQDDTVVVGEDEGCQLYLITPPAFEPSIFAERLKAALGGGPVACLQIRLKEADDDVIKRATEALLPVCHDHGVPVLMNDRPDLALLTGCDGAHVGQDDTPYGEARRILGKDAMIGVTCKASPHLAIEAAEAGADYVAFGAFFQTDTKQATVSATPEILEWWSQLSPIPSVAIGGITADNCRPLVEAGADFLAVVGGVWNHRDGEAAAVKAFGGAMARD